MEQSGMLGDMEASRPFCSIFVALPRIPALRSALFFFGGEKWHLEHSGMGGENLSLKDSLTIHRCIWGKGWRGIGLTSPGCGGAILAPSQYP